MSIYLIPILPLTVKKKNNMYNIYYTSVTETIRSNHTMQYLSLPQI